jgi:multiple sugar transport system substrate-binding protein
MGELYSRRSFLAGVLTAGLLSSAAGYLFTRRDPVTLTLATGAEPTGGGRNLLINMWNELNPDIRIAVREMTAAITLILAYLSYPESREMSALLRDRS